MFPPYGSGYDLVYEKLWRKKCVQSVALERIFVSGECREL